MTYQQGRKGSAIVAQVKTSQWINIIQPFVYVDA